jgi:hypothetical protein
MAHPPAKTSLSIGRIELYQKIMHRSIATFIVACHEITGSGKSQSVDFLIDGRIKVLPEPVTPLSPCIFCPDSILRINSAIACG